MSSECVQSTSTMTPKTDEDFLECVQNFPAVFDKSKKIYCNRDISMNGWKSIAPEMNITVEDAKKWWAQLLREYRNERNQRNLEIRSGSGAIIKREQFSLHDSMQDMLVNSYATGVTYSNYMPSSDGNCTQQQLTLQQLQLSHNIQGGYTFKKASGRSGRKTLEVKETIETIDSTLKYGYKMMEAKDKSIDLTNTNEIIGSIVQSELKQMGVERSARKRKELHKLLTDYESSKSPPENDD